MKYKIGDILKNKVNSIELMITRIDKGDNTYYLNNCWEPEHYLDENYELLTPHEDEPPETPKETEDETPETPKESEDGPWRANTDECYFYISDEGDIYLEALS